MNNKIEFDTEFAKLNSSPKGSDDHHSSASEAIDESKNNVYTTQYKSKRDTASFLLKKKNKQDDKSSQRSFCEGITSLPTLPLNSSFVRQDFSNNNLNF